MVLIKQFQHYESLTFLAFLLVILSISCTSKNLESEQTSAPAKNVDFELLEQPFYISLDLTLLEEDLYEISATIELEKGSYVVSPFSKDTIFGHFDISIKDNEYLNFEGMLEETPNAVEEFDKVINMPVKLVRGKTCYKQRVRLSNQNDFEVAGMIWFVLEPRCIPYDVEFAISHHSGNLKIQKTKTAISKEYGL